MIWSLSHRADRAAAHLADRHYNRQSIGHPQFVPPGRCMVLLSHNAVWVTSWPNFARHAWCGAWINTMFRNEGGSLSSDLIRDAVSATRWRWPQVPELGMVTFVDAAKVRKKRDPGRCYARAGFTHVGYTHVHRLWVYQMLIAAMPGAVAPHDAQHALI